MDTAKQNALELSRVRFEIIPLKSEKGENLLRRKLAFLPSGANVAITCSENTEFDPVMRMIKIVADLGCNPIPHIPARMVRGVEHLEKIVAEFQERGACEIFVPGGDMSVPRGEFSSALELLEALYELPYKFQRIGVAAHPQGHPLIHKEVLIEALRAKQKYADYAITQISGSHKVIKRWLCAIRERGITIPVYVGIIGCVKRERLIKIANNFSRKMMTWFITRNPQIFFRTMMTDTYTPDRMIDRLIFSDDIAGIHLNTFNSIEETEKWRKRFVAYYD